MPDFATPIRLNENRKIIADLQPEEGTETIAGVVVTLFDNTGKIIQLQDNSTDTPRQVDHLPLVQGGNGGWDVSAEAEPKAWYQFCAFVIGVNAGMSEGLPIGTYALAFQIADADVDNREPVIMIGVNPDWL